MEPTLSFEDLARRTGESAETLRRWRELGLLPQGAIEWRDVERVRLLQLLLRRGASVEDVASRRERLAGWVEPYLATRFEGDAAPITTVAEAAEAVQLPRDYVESVWGAIHPGDHEKPLGAEDVQLLRWLKEALQFGFPADAALQVVRVFGDAMARATQATSRLYHLYVHEARRRQGMDQPEIQWGDESLQRLRDLAEPVLLYFYRQGRVRAEHEDIVLHLVGELGLPDGSELPGEMLVAVLFVDLAGFTPLADTMGNRKAVEILDRFGVLVREAAGRWAGRVIKQIGDAFMLVFLDAHSAVRCALEIERDLQREPAFPAARSGVHWGAALYQDGDYIGASVNLAARLAGAAEPHQTVVTAEVRDAVSGADIEFTARGRRHLKGIVEEVAVFEARPASHQPAQRRIDPVCRMELSPGEEVARLDLEGVEHVFCSEECLRRFVASPASYGS